MSAETEKKMLDAIVEHAHDEGVEFDEVRAAEVRLVVKRMVTRGQVDFTNRTYFRTVKDHDAGLILNGQWPQPEVEPPIIHTHGLL